MYLKVYADGNNTYKAGRIIYEGISAKNAPLYEEAARFLNKLLDIKEDVVVRIKDDANLNKKLRGAFFHKLFKYIYIAKMYKYSEVIIHETIHQLSAKKVLPSQMTNWVPRAIDMSYKLIKLQEAGKKLEDFRNTSIYTNLWNMGKLRHEEMLFQFGYDYYKTYRKDATTKYLKHMVNKFDDMQVTSAGFFDKENYEMGAFVAGIVKGILEETGNTDTVISFFRKLTAKRPLEDVISEFTGGKNYPRAYVLAQEAISCLNKADLPLAVTWWAPTTTEIVFEMVESWVNFGTATGSKNYEFNQFVEAGYSYYDIHKTTFNSTDRRYRWIVEGFDKMQSAKKFKDLRIAPEKIGVFIAGIVKGILNDKNNIEPVISFLNNLTNLNSLQYAMTELNHR